MRHRPPLATAIAVLMFISVLNGTHGVFLLGSRLFAHASIVSVSSYATLACAILQTILGLVGGIYLWGMEPSTVKIFAARIIVGMIAVSLQQMGSSVFHHPWTRVDTVMNTLGFIFEIAITWYVWKVTSPTSNS